MGLFYNYNVSGKGVAKNAPKKKPFFRFWELFASKFWKLISLNFLYFISSGIVFVIAGFLASAQTKNLYLMLIGLPVFILFGPATAAMSQVVRKFTIEKPIFMWDEYKTAFKNNFKQALPIGIFDVFFFMSFAYGIFFYSSLLENQPTPGNYILVFVSTAVAAYFLMAHFYVYLEIVSLTLPLGKIIKNALLLTIMGIKVNIINIVIWLAFISGAVLLLPYSVLVLPVIPFGWLAFLCAFNCYPIIQKYIINPYYESRGEKNPELPDDDGDEDENAKKDRIFTDRGGMEEEINNKQPLTRRKTSKPAQVKGSGKIIK